MAFFKFLKKSKKREPGILDVPPPPTPEIEKLKPPLLEEKSHAELPKPIIPIEKKPYMEELPRTIEPKPVLVHPAKPITPSTLPDELEPAPSPQSELEAPPIPHRKAKLGKDLFKKEYEEAIMEKREIPKGPIFITIKRYKNIMERIDSVRNKLKESQDTLFRLTEMESSKDEQYGEWQKTLKELEKKLILIEKKTFG